MFPLSVFIHMQDEELLLRLDKMIIKMRNAVKERQLDKKQKEDQMTDATLFSVISGWRKKITKASLSLCQAISSISIIHDVAFLSSL